MWLCLDFLCALPLPLLLFMLVPPEAGVGGEGSGPGPLAIQGPSAARESLVQRGEGLVWGRGAGALLRDRKEDQRVARVWWESQGVCLRAADA